MALKIQASYSAGELDPALHERTNLTKYKTGLATARNVVIGKTGRIMDRPAKKYKNTAKTTGVIRIHPIPSGYLEFGVNYVRWYSTDGTLLVADVNSPSITISAIQLPSLRFQNVRENGADYVMIMLDGTDPIFLLMVTDLFNVVLTTVFDRRAAPTAISNTIGGTGYDLDYAFTSVIDGTESLILEQAIGKLPIANSEINTIVVKYGLATGGNPVDNCTEVRVYRRPRAAGAYGFVGSSTAFTIAGGTSAEATFTDFGQDADYTNGPPTLNPTLVNEELTDPFDFQSIAASIYQQRLILAYDDKLETSRTAFPFNFSRDYPLGADSSISMNAGGEPDAIVKWIIENNGLIAFTSRGVFLHSGPITPTNLTMQRKGKWVIDDLVPPIAIPGGVLFIDAATNAVRELTFSEEAGTYVAPELSIFSEHLFKSNRVKSWAFEEGILPLLWVVFTDGTFASFTFDRVHEMKAWTRGDSRTNVEEVILTRSDPSYSPFIDAATTILFVTKNPTTEQRYVEAGVPRLVSATISEADFEWDKNESIAALDSMVSWSHLLNDDALLGGNTLTLAPVVADTWDGDLTLTAGGGSLFAVAGMGAIGTVFRHFDPADRVSYDLTVTARASDVEVTVFPNVEFPSANASDPRLYEAKATFTGLDHMEGETVSIVRDGFIAASPNNTRESYTDVTVSSGSITLPDSLLGAIVHIGRPYVADIETLDIDTVEQRPVLIESMTINKLYFKVHNTRGFYAASRFPADDTLDGLDQTNLHNVDMGDISNLSADYEAANPITGNRYDQPITKRVEFTMPGDWNSQGRVAIRNVDPIHFEILSIMPDVQDIKRFNRRGEEL